MEFYNAHNSAEQASEGGDISAAWSKLEGYAARLALILHCVRSVCGEADGGEVDEVSLRGGIILETWLAGEAQRVYRLCGYADEDSRLEGEKAKLSSFIIVNYNGRITTQELRDSKARYHAPGAARDALCELVEGGYGRWIYPSPGERGGRPSEVFEVTPAVSAKPTIPPSAIRETPSRDSASEGIAVGDGLNEGVVRMGEDDRDYSAGEPDERLGVMQ